MTASAEKFTRQTLLDVQSLTPSLFTLRTTRDPGFRFTAGQFVRLGVTKADGSTVWRAYSVVSSPFDEHLDFFSIVVPGGEFTSELSRLRVGDTLMVERFRRWPRFVDAGHRHRGSAISVDAAGLRSLGEIRAHHPCVQRARRQRVGLSVADQGAG